MTIIVDTAQGIRLQLASAVPTPLHHSREAGGYYKVRSYHGGGEFFQPENAQVILQCLGEFLPRAIERASSDGRMEIFYQHLSNGQDMCSRTAPLDAGVNVPKSEITRLEAAIAQLKAKENDLATDPTKREIIRAFRLPSPQKDPELYRMYGSGSNRRLLVLWGVEKEVGSSLSPQDALQHVPQTKCSIPWWVWLLLAIILLTLLGWWWSLQHPESAIGKSLPGSSTPTPILVLEPEPSNADSSNETVPGNDPFNSLAGSVAPASSRPSESAPKAASLRLPVDSKKDDSVASAPIEATLDASTNGDTPSPMPKTESPPGESEKSESDKPGESPPSAKAIEGTPPTVPISPEAPTDTPGPKSAMASDSPKSTEPPTSPNPTMKRTPPPVASVIPLNAEIVNARTSAVPKDGKIEVQLSALARDLDGKAITISKIEAWTVDGKPQLDDAGRPINTNGLPLNLSIGVHRVRATGTAADGRQIVSV